MGIVQLTVFARSDMGRVRKNNEDSFMVTDLDSGERVEDAGAQTAFDVRKLGILMVVSDGMGGHAAGEVASALVVDSLRKSLGSAGADEPSMQRLIDSAVKRANSDVFEAARETRKKGMGATLTAILVHHDEAYVAEVGDSRAYLLRSGRLRQITKDQSFVQLLVDAGAITPEQAKVSDRKNVILQGMGLQEDVQVSIGRVRLRRGDRLLICCDGLSNLVHDAELRDLLQTPDLATACNRMVDLANERGGDDNITAIVAALDGVGLPVPPPDESVTETFDVLQEFSHDGKSTSQRPAANKAATPHAIEPPAPPAGEPQAPSVPPPPSTDSPPSSPWPLLGAVVTLIAVIAFVFWSLR